VGNGFIVLLVPTRRRGNAVGTLGTHLTVGVPTHVLGGGGPTRLVKNVFWTP